jgi:hypothetical protein
MVEEEVAMPGFCGEEDEEVEGAPSCVESRGALVTSDRRFRTRPIAGDLGSDSRCGRAAEQPACRWSYNAFTHATFEVANSAESR